MATNPNVEVDRLRYIGGSDIPIIMNISPFKKRFDLLKEKVGLIESDFNGNEYTEYGNVMESKIRDYVNSFFKVEFKEGTFFDDGDEEALGIRCNVDGETSDTILEIKTTSQIHGNVNDYPVYLVQLLFYMLHSNRNYGILAIYERPKDFNEDFDKKRLKIYEIKKDDYKDLIERINQAVNQFNNDYKALKENPFLIEEELLPYDIVSVSNALEIVENKLKALKELEEQEKKFKAQLLDLMIKNNIKSWSTLNGAKITRVDATPTTIKEVEEFNVAKFKDEEPETYAKYVETKKVENKGKSGYVKITLPND